MLLDMQRWSDRIDRRFPPARGSRRADRADGARDRELRPWPTSPLAHHWRERRGRALDPRDGRPHAARRSLRRGVRRVGRRDGAHPVHRAMARRDPAGALRARPAPAVGAVGDDSLPLDPAARGARHRPECHGPVVAAPPAARHLRPARRRRDLRVPGDPRRAAAPRCGQSRVGVLPRAARARAVDRTAESGDPTSA